MASGVSHKNGTHASPGYCCATGRASITLCLNNIWHSMADRLQMSKPETGLGRAVAYTILMLYKGTKICYDKTGLMLAQGYSCATGLAWVTLCLNNSWHSIADSLLMSKPERGLGRDMVCTWGERGEVTSSQMRNIPLFPLMMHAMSLPYY